MDKLDYGHCYGLWAEHLVANGWQPYLLSFMFEPLPGSPALIERQMFAAIETVYGRYWSRVVRRSSCSLRLPIWFCAGDLPVPKHEKQILRDIDINNGLHVQGFGMNPLWSRLKVSVEEHFERDQARYIAGTPLDRIHVKPVTRTVSKAVDYVAKTVSSGRLSTDAVLILPRTRREMMDTIRNERGEWVDVRRRKFDD